MYRMIAILSRRRRMFAIPFLVVFLVPTLASLAFMRTYQADAVLWLDADISIGPLLDESAPASQVDPIQEVADTLRQLVETRAFATKVIEGTQLEGRMRTARERERTLEYLRRNLRLDTVGPNSLRVSFYGRSPKEAVAVAGSVTERFTEWVSESVRQQNGKSLEFFEEQTALYHEELTAASAGLQTFREEHPEVRDLEIRDKVLTPPKVSVSAAVQSELEQLKAEEEYAREIYDSSLGDLAETRVRASAREERYVNGLHVVDAPTPPTSFSKRRLLLAASLALVAAVALGGLAAAVAEVADPSFSTGDDVRQALGLPVLVAIGPETAGSERS